MTVTTIVVNGQTFIIVETPKPCELKVEPKPETSIVEAVVGLTVVWCGLYYIIKFAL